MDISESELNATASRLRSAFAKRKSRNIPNFRLSSRESNLKWWRNNALKMLENDADIDEWIEAGFEFNNLENGPYASAFGTPRAAENYRRYRTMYANHNSSDAASVFVEESFNHFKRLKARNSCLPPDEQLSEEELVLDPWNRVRSFVAVSLYPGNKKIVDALLPDARQFVRGSRILLDAIEKNGGSTKLLE